MSRASTCRMASEVPVTVAALTTSGMSTQARLQLGGRDGAVAVDLHVGLGVPTDCVAVDDGRETADDAVVEHPVDPPFDRRRGQVHPLPDLGERRPRVVDQLGQNPLVGLVQTVHVAPTPTPRNKTPQF